MKINNTLVDLAIAELSNHILILNKLALANNQANRYSAFSNYAKDAEMAILLLKHACDPTVIIPTDEIDIASILLPIKSIIDTCNRSISKKRFNSQDSIKQIVKVKESLDYAVKIIESYH